MPIGSKVSISPHAEQERTCAQEALVHVAPRYELHYIRRPSFALAAAPTGYTLRCVLAGRVRLLVRQEAFEIEPGMSILLDPTTPSVLRAQRGGVELISLHMHPSLVADMAARLRLTRIGEEFTFRARVVADPHLVALFLTLREEMRRSDIGRDVVLGALVEQMLVHLFREHFLIRRNLDLEFSRFGPVDRRVRRAIEFIHTHFDERMSLRDMARAAFLSAFHFARLFKRLVGMTPHAYLANVRLEQAARWLATTDLSVLEISQRVGYASQSHFAKAFKAWTGLTPREYRQASSGGLRAEASRATERKK